MGGGSIEEPGLVSLEDLAAPPIESVTAQTAAPWKQAEQSTNKVLQTMSSGPPAVN